ncbi:DUF6221 family protein [Nonomuraea wenchangensis]
MASDEMLSWLKATIEGDKAKAEANGGQEWTVQENSWEEGWSFIQTGEGGEHGKSCGCCGEGTIETVAGTHMAIHDPRDTIARCEAELRLIDRLDAAAKDSVNYDLPARHLAEDAIEALASGYRHRPGFKPEWVSG